MLLSLVITLGMASSTVDSLSAQLEAIAKPHAGVVGYSIHHLKRREVVERLADEPFPSASTIKTAVMCTAMDKISRGELKYSDTREFTEADKRGGAGFIQNYKLGTKLELKELLHLMITVSDNSATAMMIRWLGCMEVNRWLDAHGLPKTHLLSQLPEGETELRKLNEKWGLGVTTPREMRQLLEQILDGRAGSLWACEEMRRILSHQYFNDLIAKEFPPSFTVASKSGALNASRSDTAIVHTPGGDIVLSLFTKENTDESWGASNQAEAIIKRLAAAVSKRYSGKTTWLRPISP